MSGPTAAPHVQRYGTRLLRTQIEAEGEAFRWIRTPGMDARQDFAPPVHLPDLLSQDGDGAVPLIGGHPVGPGRTYVVAGHQSAAGLLLEERFGAGFDRHLNGLGRALRRLHESAPSAEAGHLAAPRALGRARLNRGLYPRRRPRLA